MKNYVYLLLILCGFFTFSSCSEELDYNDPDVTLFVKELKAGTYDLTNANGVIEVPKFTREDIPELLKYADDLTIIPSFPLPPVSSYLGSKVRLGECLLWVVESVRTGQPASLGCKMVKADAPNYEGIYFLTDQEVHEAVDRYRHWWTHNAQHPMTVWSVIPCYDDPLCGSDFRWW